MNIEVSLCALFAKNYRENKSVGVTYIPDTIVAKIVMTKMYNQFVNDGLLVPIEFLPEEKKIELVDECRRVKDSFYTNESLRVQCRILHAINIVNSKLEK